MKNQFFTKNLIIIISEIKLKKNKIIFHNGYQLQNDDKINYLKKKIKKIKNQIISGFDWT